MLCAILTIQQPALASRSGFQEMDLNLETSDEREIENEISKLERMVYAIDLNVSSTQRSLEGIYNLKCETEPRVADPSHPHKPSLLRRARSLFDRISRRTLSTAVIGITNFSLLGDLNDALHHTESALQRLIRERHLLATDLKHRQTELIRRNGKLPVELWAKIFLLCLPDEEFVTPNPQQAPLLLCQICTQWRRVAVGTPLLWNTLSIRTSWRRRIWKSSLECWLSRSANACLYLAISTPSFMDDGCFDHHVLKTIIATADRWYHLRLNLPSNLLRALLKNHMPRLQALEFSSAEHIISLNLQPCHVPKLKIISSLTKAIYLQHLFLPWAQLTHVSSQCWLNISQHVEVLSNCPNLQSYTMSLIHTDRPWHHDVRKVVHQKLHSLHITSFIENTTAPTVDLTLLQLPNLADLTLVIPKECLGYGVMRWPKVEILSLIQRSSCLLFKLRFRGMFITEEDMQSAKKAIPLPTIIDFQCSGPYTM